MELLLIVVLLGISVVDIRTNRIPNKLVLLIMALGIILAVANCYNDNSIQPIIDGAIGLMTGGLPFAIIILVTNGGLGAGDMKLYAALGIFFGWKSMLCIIVMSVLITGMSAVLLLLLKVKDKKEQIAMAPFIAAATIIMILFKPQIYLFLKYYYGM